MFSNPAAPPLAPIINIFYFKFDTRTSIFFFTCLKDAPGAGAALKSGSRTVFLARLSRFWNSSHTFHNEVKGVTSLVQLELKPYKVDSKITVCV